MTTRRLPGLALVLSGPSGGGKTSVCGELLRRRDDVEFSISATTRPPRPAEIDGRHYRFVSREDFSRMTETAELIEWAEVHGELYGTPRDQLERCLEAGKTLLLDIDVQGARGIREQVPDAVLVFLLPPSAESMLERLDGRGSEDEETLRRRMRSAVAELEAVGEFDYGVVNEELDATVDIVEAILEAERRAVTRQGNQLAERARALAGALRGALTV
jgi:guanylate kinase